jgi:GTP-binding protein
VKVVQAEYLASAQGAGSFPPPVLAEVAFLGRSNVGKSSLMNSLLERKGLVRTSSTPGCTRQVSWFRATGSDGSILDLVDLPGYGYAKRSKSERNEWAHLIENYLLERPSLRAAVLLVDARRGPEQEEQDLLTLLQSPGRVSRPPLQTIFVATKLDKLSRAAQKPRLQEIAKVWGQKVHGFSAETGEGRDALWSAVRRAAGLEVPASELPA